MSVRKSKHKDAWDAEDMADINKQQLQDLRHSIRKKKVEETDSVKIKTKKKKLKKLEVSFSSQDENGDKSDSDKPRKRGRPSKKPNVITTPDKKIILSSEEKSTSKRKAFITKKSLKDLRRSLFTPEIDLKKKKKKRKSDLESREKKSPLKVRKSDLISPNLKSPLGRPKGSKNKKRNTYDLTPKKRKPSIKKIVTPNTPTRPVGRPKKSDVTVKTHKKVFVSSMKVSVLKLKSRRTPEIEVGRNSKGLSPQKNEMTFKTHRKSLLTTSRKTISPLKSLDVNTPLKKRGRPSKKSLRATLKLNEESPAKLQKLVQSLSPLKVISPKKEVKKHKKSLVSSAKKMKSIVSSPMEVRSPGRPRKLSLEMVSLNKSLDKKSPRTPGRPPKAKKNKSLNKSVVTSTSPMKNNKSPLKPSVSSLNKSLNEVRSPGRPRKLSSVIDLLNKSSHRSQNVISPEKKEISVKTHKKILVSSAKKIKSSPMKKNKSPLKFSPKKSLNEVRSPGRPRNKSLETSSPKTPSRSSKVISPERKEVISTKKISFIVSSPKRTSLVASPMKNNKSPLKSSPNKSLNELRSPGRPRKLALEIDSLNKSLSPRSHKVNNPEKKEISVKTHKKILVASAKIKSPNKSVVSSPKNTFLVLSPKKTVLLNKSLVSSPKKSLVSSPMKAKKSSPKKLESPKKTVSPKKSLVKTSSPKKSLVSSPLKNQSFEKFFDAMSPTSKSPNSSKKTEHRKSFIGVTLKTRSPKEKLLKIKLPIGKSPTNLSPKMSSSKKTPLVQLKNSSPTKLKTSPLKRKTESTNSPTKKSKQVQILDTSMPPSLNTTIDLSPDTNTKPLTREGTFTYSPKILRQGTFVKEETPVKKITLNSPRPFRSILSKSVHLGKTPKKSVMIMLPEHTPTRKGSMLHQCTPRHNKASSSIFNDSLPSLDASLEGFEFLETLKLVRKSNVDQVKLDSKSVPQRHRRNIGTSTPITNGTSPSTSSVNTKKSIPNGKTSTLVQNTRKSITSRPMKTTSTNAKSKIAVRINKPKIEKNGADAKKEGGFNRFGFNMTKGAMKEEAKKIVSTKSRTIENAVDKRRDVIKGVRSNRRFDLLMNMRKQ